jgi:S1-C subfamily serine protease
MKIVIDHIAGSRRGQRQEFEPGDRVRFGRHPENEVSFDAHRDLDASSRHAELLREGSRFVLRDIGSSNGLFVDSEKVVVVPVAIGEPLEVAFGAAGPRVRLFIGEQDDVPPPPSASSLHLPRTISGAPQSHTIGMMWREASAEAGRAGGLASAPTLFRALAREAVQHSSRRFKIAMSLLATILVAVIGGVIFWQLTAQQRLDRERREDAERLAEIERERAIRETQRERDTAEDPAAGIAADYGGAVYLFVVERADGTAGFCTGFAVTQHHLATNAHCIEAAQQHKADRHRVFAVRNGAAERLAIGKMFPHPRYQGALSEDVGLVEIRGELETRVRLADRERLEKLRKGANVFTLGFPGRLATRVGDSESPEATIVDGIIGRITNFRGERAAFEDELLVQHNLLTAPGSSGSPIFDGFGNVVAINAGRFTESRSQEQVVLTPGANYAIRIDALREVLRENDLDVPQGGGT